MASIVRRSGNRGKPASRGPVALWTTALAICLTTSTLTACSEDAPPAAPIRPVRTVVVDPEPLSNTYSAPGEIRARYETPIAFRLSGKILARKVDVGSVVKAGDQIAVLDDRDQRNALDAAKSD